jgi:hypothetical protein
MLFFMVASPLIKFAAYNLLLGIPSSHWRSEAAVLRGPSVAGTNYSMELCVAKWRRCYRPRDAHELGRAACRQEYRLNRGTGPPLTL